MSEISTKAGVFESGEKDEYGVAYQGKRLTGCSNKSLTEYSVKEGTEVICDRAFMNARDLRSITIPVSVRAIGESAFAGCKSLENINIPEGVTEIRQSTFRDCKSLGCLELPASCVKVDKWAFSDGLETLVCNAPSMQIDKLAFFGCKTLTTVMVPEGSAVTYAQALVDCRLTPDIEELEMSYELPPDSSSDGNGSLKENDQLIAWSNLRNKENVNGKYGFVDENGNWIIEPQFGFADKFSEGLAAVKVAKKWGYIRPDGTWAIKPQFDDVNAFSQGLASVKVDGKYGYIRPDGTWAIEPQFDYANDFSEGLAVVEVDEKYGFIRPDGTLAIEPQFDYAYHFSQGLARVKVDDKYGYIRPDGTWAIEPQFDYADDISEELAKVKVDGKWGFIRPDGSWVFEPQFDDAYDFSQGLARVKVDGKYGYIRPDGTWAIEPQFDYAMYFSQELASVEVDGKYGYIRPDGSWAIEPQFDFAKHFSEGLAVVEVDEKWGFIRSDGTWAVEPQFEEAWGFSSDGKAEVKLNGKYVFLQLHPDGSWNIEEKEDDEDETMVTLYFYGEAVRIDVMDKKDDLMDSFMAMRDGEIYDIDLWVGDDIESISTDDLGETLNAFEEDDPDYKESYDWGYWPNMYKPTEVFDNVGRLVWIMSKTGAYVKIELKDGEKFDPKKFRLLSSEIVTPDGEFEVYCGALYNGKEYPLEIDIDSDDEKGQQDLWIADDDE